MYYKLNKDLQLVKSRTFKFAFIFSCCVNIGMCILLYYFSSLPPLIKTVNRFIPYDKFNTKDVVLSDTPILKVLMEEGCLLPNVALVQAKLESSYFKSQVCKENKNLFGIKFHKCSFVKGKNLNHAVYASYKDNIKCYVDIQNHYLGNIDGHYAMAPAYVENIKKFKK